MKSFAKLFSIKSYKSSVQKNRYANVKNESEQQAITKSESTKRKFTAFISRKLSRKDKSANGSSCTIAYSQISLKGSETSLKNDSSALPQLVNSMVVSKTLHEKPKEKKQVIAVPAPQVTKKSRRQSVHVVSKKGSKKNHLIRTSANLDHSKTKNQSNTTQHTNNTANAKLKNNKLPKQRKFNGCKKKNPIEKVPAKLKKPPVKNVKKIDAKQKGFSLPNLRMKKRNSKVHPVSVSMPKISDRPFGKPQRKIKRSKEIASKMKKSISTHDVSHNKNTRKNTNDKDILNPKLFALRRQRHLTRVKAEPEKDVNLDFDKLPLLKKAHKPVKLSERQKEAKQAYAQRRSQIIIVNEIFSALHDIDVMRMGEIDIGAV